MKKTLLKFRNIFIYFQFTHQNSITELVLLLFQGFFKTHYKFNHNFFTYITKK